MKVEKIVLYILILFNLLTLLIFAYQPIKSVGDHHTLTVFYIFINIMSFYLGYRSFNNREIVVGKIENKPLYRVSNQLVTYIFIFYLLTFMIKYAYELYCPPFSISSLISRIKTGLISAREGYFFDGSQYIPWAVYMPICIINDLFFVLGFLLWRRLKNSYRILFILLIIFDVLKWFGKGTNFGVVIMILTSIFAFLANYTKDRMNAKNIKKVSICVISLFVIAVLAFGRNMQSRSGGDFASLYLDQIFDINYNSVINNYFLSNLSYAGQSLYCYVTNYLTNGYNCLECIFDCSFTPCFGFGNNGTIASFGRILGFDVEPNSYLTQIYYKYGLDQYVNWHSCYAWIANDVSIYGVPFVVFFIGRFTYTSLLLYRKYNDLLSGIVFVVFSVMVMFFFANNNYLASVFYPFMFLFPVWLVTRYLNLKVRIGDIIPNK